MSLRRTPNRELEDQNGVAGNQVGRGGRSYGGSISLPAIEKLRGRENYTTWSFAMKMSLIREGTWSAVKPREGQAVDEDMSLRALSAICLSLETYNYSHVVDAGTAAKAWENLENVFQDNGSTRRIGLL